MIKANDRLTAEKGAELVTVLGEMVRAVDAGGGLLSNGCPVRASDWVELGECYRMACKALFRPPLYKN
jgi:hypothetical protein